MSYRGRGKRRGRPSMEGVIKSVMSKYGGIDVDTKILETTVNILDQQILIYPYNMYDTKGGAYPTDTFDVGQTLFEGIGKTTGQTNAGVDLDCSFFNASATTRSILDMLLL